MKRFFQPLSVDASTSGGGNRSVNNVQNTRNASVQGESTEQSGVGRAFTPDDIVADPALRRPIEKYDKNVQDQVRRAYILKGPCQPKDLDFPRRQYGQRSRRFKEKWYSTYNWLEYSESKDAVYCFY